MTSPHANYVLQKLVTQLTWSKGASFVAWELRGDAADLARHRFGCRIFCRLIEFHAAKEGTEDLVEEVLQEAEDLAGIRCPSCVAGHAHVLELHNVLRDEDLAVMWTPRLHLEYLYASPLDVASLDVRAEIEALAQIAHVNLHVRTATTETLAEVGFLGQRRVIWLHGKAGIGKSALLSEFCRFYAMPGDRLFSRTFRGPGDGAGPSEAEAAAGGRATQRGVQVLRVFGLGPEAVLERLRVALAEMPKGGPPTLLALDGVEESLAQRDSKAGELWSFLGEALALSSPLRLLLASREPRYDAPLPGKVVAMEVPPLSREDACLLLARRAHRPLFPRDLDSTCRPGGDPLALSTRRRELLLSGLPGEGLDFGGTAAMKLFLAVLSLAAAEISQEQCRTGVLRKNRAPEQQAWCCALYGLCNTTTVGRRLLGAQAVIQVGADIYDCNEGLDNVRLFDCESGYMNWVHGWSPGKKIWCCQNTNRGCPPTTMTMTATATTTETSTFPGCMMHCTLDNVKVTCEERIHFASVHTFLGEVSPCQMAHDLVLRECGGVCDHCPIRVACLGAANVPTSTPKPTTLPRTTLKSGSSEGKDPFDCQEGLEMWQMVWFPAKQECDRPSPVLAMLLFQGDVMLEGSLVTWKRSSSRAGRRSAGVAKNPLRSSTALQDGSVRKYVDYRLDPAPVWGGDQPEKNFKEYQRNLQLWLVEAEARLPHNLIGKRILDSIPLGSKLSALLAHLTVDEITAENGHKIIVGLIESAHEYLKDHRLEQAFEEAIFRGKRDKGTSLTAFLTSKRAAFAELRKQGLDLLETSAGRHLLGHLILRQGAFSQDQKQRLKVVTNGSIDFKDLELAIQKVFGDKLDDAQHEAPHPHHPRRWRSNAYFDEEGDDADWDDEAAASTCGEFYEEEEDWFEDLIALNDDGSEAQLVFPQELPVVMDEHEAIETFGSGLEEVFYEFQNRLHHGKGRGKGKKGKGGKGKHPARTYGQSAPSHGKGGGGHLEHRRLLQASRNGRGYDRPWQQRQGSRMSLSEIKSKTRCHQCKQIGHWSRECPQKGKMLGSSASSPARSVMSGNSMSTGFFTEPPKLMSGFGQRHLVELGYAESVFDPCLFYLWPNDDEIANGPELQVAGIVLLDVDDFCQGGGLRHQELMSQLRTRLKFGKWKNVHKSSAEYIGRTLTQLENFEIQVSMKRYIQEKLKAVTLDKSRLKDKSSLLSEQEISWLRGVGGSLLWVGKEGRPDVAAACAMSMSWSAGGPTVEHILAANKTVNELKQTPDVVLRIIPIDPACGIWMSIADASMANVDNKSQGGFIMAMADRSILDGQKAAFSINSWKSHRLKRVVKATLGSEALAMDDALAEIEWLRAFWHEVMDPASTVIDVAVIHVSAAALRVKTFWVPGTQMLADPLTKRLGNSALLRKAMSEATYALVRQEP
eukprot:g21330.t1